VSLKVIIVGIV